MDISSDLTELGHTKVVVICAGIKSILDVGKTLEHLVYRAFDKMKMGLIWFRKRLVFRYAHWGLLMTFRIFIPELVALK
jgi:pseudouridine-5'-phosphate glycosidase